MVTAMLHVHILVLALVASSCSAAPLDQTGDLSQYVDQIEKQLNKETAMIDLQFAQLNQTISKEIQDENLLGMRRLTEAISRHTANFNEQFNKFGQSIQDDFRHFTGEQPRHSEGIAGWFRGIFE
ncbi:hypothetical protein HDE_12135 [Halotydeus destructor]|nr:hypothetical protein HDE_12135 [Halotydeus destructor]